MDIYNGADAYIQDQLDSTKRITLVPSLPVFFVVGQGIEIIIPSALLTCQFFQKSPHA